MLYDAYATRRQLRSGPFHANDSANAASLYQFYASVIDEFAAA